jgi:UDP-N-acetylglucosamine--N-acetylmuramyl-(pentapeptide) pyrophosphoryl-undecaprenol N-acetylglucosamine transferase
VVGGNPVRGQITADHPQTSAREAFGLDALRPTVLVFGGSLGARSLNEAMQQAVDRWVQTKTAPDFQILWQTGDHFSANVSDALKDRLRVVQFIDDMGMAYAAADVVVARSGATTIAELGIVGKPAILIPLPSASTNEQRYNADIVARHGAAIIIDDADVRTTMVDTMQALMIDPGRRESMSGAMRSLGRPDAASIAAGLVLKAASRTTEGVA